MLRRGRRRPLTANLPVETSAKMNVLGVTMGCRDFKITRFWREQITMIDRLEISNYLFEEAHKIARNYFLSHPEYSHLLVIAEDVVVTPDHVRLILDDYEKTHYPVIAGVINIAFHSTLLAIGRRDLRGVNVMHTKDYHMYDLLEVLTDKTDYPFQKVFFNGKALMLVRRDVMEKVSFGPYTYWVSHHMRRKLGSMAPKKGTMFDLKFALECAQLEVPVYADLRLLMFHTGDTDETIEFRGKWRTVTLHRADGTKFEVCRDTPIMEGP